MGGGPFFEKNRRGSAVVKQDKLRDIQKFYFRERLYKHRSDALNPAACSFLKEEKKGG
jgi:hypothetical protein